MGFDPESVSDGIRSRIDLLLKLFQLGYQLFPTVITGVIGQVFSYPLPEVFHRHEVGTVARQRQQVDPQLIGPLDYRLCPVIGRPITEHRERYRWELPAEGFQPLKGRLAVGTLVRIQLNLALVIKVDPVTGHFRSQPWRIGT